MELLLKDCRIYSHLSSQLLWIQDAHDLYFRETTESNNVLQGRSSILLYQQQPREGGDSGRIAWDHGWAQSITDLSFPA